MNFNYHFTIEKDEPNGYLVQFIDIPEAFTCGDTIEECLFNAKEVLDAILESRLDKNDEIPEPSKAKTVADMIFKLTGSAIPRDLISSWLQEQEETGNSEILTAHIKEHLLNANAPG